MATDDGSGSRKRRRSIDEPDEAGGSSRRKRNKRWGSLSMVVSASGSPVVELRRRATYSSMFATPPLLTIGPVFYSVAIPTGLASLLTNRYAGTVDRKFYATLLSRVNPRNMTFVFWDGEVRRITVRDAVRIFGVTGRGRLVEFGAPPHRSDLMDNIRRYLRLEGTGAVSVKDCREVISKINPCCMTREDTFAFMVAVTIVVCATFLGPRQSVHVIPEEKFLVVQDPTQIGSYNTDLVKMARRDARSLHADVLAGMDASILCGNPLFLKCFTLDWIDFGNHNLHPSFGPRIAAYTHDQVAKLIKLIKANPTAYRTRPDGYITNLQMQWHPLVAGSITLDNVEEISNFEDDVAVDSECTVVTTTLAEPRPIASSGVLGVEPTVMSTPPPMAPSATTPLRRSIRISAAEKGKKAAAIESEMESSDSDENDEEIRERRSRNACRHLRRQDMFGGGAEEGILLGDGGGPAWHARVVNQGNMGSRQNRAPIDVVEPTSGAASEMDTVLQEITTMQVEAVETPMTVKGEIDVHGTQQPRVVDIDVECAMQLQTKLAREYVLEEI